MIKLPKGEPPRVAKSLQPYKTNEVPWEEYVVVTSYNWIVETPFAGVKIPVPFKSDRLICKSEGMKS